MNDQEQFQPKHKLNFLCRVINDAEALREKLKDLQRLSNGWNATLRSSLDDDIAQTNQTFKRLRDAARRIDPDSVEASIASEVSDRTVVAPPIGLVPRWIAIRHRYDAILDAMDRFREAGSLIPVDWLTELADLSSQIEKDPRGNERRSTE